jgi:hypothetical protein
MQKKWFLLGFAAVAAFAIACGESTKTPASPTPAVSSETAAAAADGSTLKISAPTLSTPANNSTADSLTPNLVLQNATSKYVPAAVPTYQFQVVDSANATVYDSGPVGAGASQTAHQVPADKLKAEQTYRWRARGTSGSAAGPWSGYFTFTTPKGMSDVAYQTATTLWDPLTNGKTIGRQTGMEFSASGARTIGNDSNIRYDLLQTMSAGEYSFYVYNLNPLSAGDKTKLMSMQEGTGDITTDDYRFTVEKRGASYIIPSQVRIRLIAGDADEHNGRIFDSAPEVAPLEKNVWYFVRLTWGATRVVFQIYNANGTTGAIGSQVFYKDMGYAPYTYKPVPHTAWVGGPVGRGGPQDASVSNMTVKWLWIGAAGTPRPGFGQAFAPGE